MIETFGEDIFDQIQYADAICIATNCSIINKYQNPMGGGVAGAAKKRWPNIDEKYGELLRVVGHVPCILGYVDEHSNLLEFDSDDWYDGIYNYESIDDNAFCAIVAYPTMHSINYPASLDLVIRSAKLLKEMADYRNWQSIYLVSPGTGIGGLDVDVVHGELRNILDDRFMVMQK